jgi:hypothetical protein
MDQKTLLIVVGLIVLFIWMQPKNGSYATSPKPVANYARMRSANRRYEETPVMLTPPATDVPVSKYTGKTEMYQKTGEARADYAMGQAGGMKPVSNYLQQSGGLAPFGSKYAMGQAGGQAPFGGSKYSMGQAGGMKPIMAYEQPKKAGYGQMGNMANLSSGYKAQIIPPKTYVAGRPGRPAPPS